MSRLLFGLTTLIFPVLTAFGFTVSGHISGGSGFALKLVYIIPTALDTFYVTFANPFNNNYSQGGLDSGGYTLLGFQDTNINLVPDLDEPRGFYGGDIPTVLDVSSDMEGIDIELVAPNTGGFSGTISYEGTETGATFVFAHRSNSFDGIPNGTGLLFNNTGNGDYTAIVDSFGIYYAYAYMDVNTNFQYDIGEPWDVWGDDLEPEPIDIVQGESFPDGIDFELTAISSVRPQPGLAKDFQIGKPYPNPFNPETTIPFTLDKPLEIEIVAHDILGRTVKTLVHGSYPAGEHSVKFGDLSLPSGLYMIELRAQGVTSCTPAILLK